jgi:hypothetical protein
MVYSIKIPLKADNPGFRPCSPTSRARLNEETGYTIAKVKVYDRRDLVTVVGNFMTPMPGEILKMQGERANHPKYGEQFKVTRYKSLVPA